MKTRKQIENLIKTKQRKINALSDEIDLLRIEELQICDSEQTYEEKEEEWVVKRRPITKETHVIGRVHWDEDFIDEDTGDVVTINRSRLVRKDGIWIF